MNSAVPYLLTGSGGIDLAKPDPDQITVADIALSLGREGRYAGHTEEHFSVAQHSMLVAMLVPSSLRLDALLHDATEAYLKDLPRPVKVLCHDYQKLEERLASAIGERFGIGGMCAEVKQADEIAYHLEINSEFCSRLLPSYKQPYYGSPPPVPTPAQQSLVRYHQNPNALPEEYGCLLGSLAPSGLIGDCWSAEEATSYFTIALIYEINRRKEMEKAHARL